MNYIGLFVCCIGECIIVDDSGLWVVFKQILDEVCSDKSGTTGEEDGGWRNYCHLSIRRI